MREKAPTADRPALSGPIWETRGQGDQPQTLLTFPPSLIIFPFVTRTLSFCPPIMASFYSCPFPSQPYYLLQYSRAWGGGEFAHPFSLFLSVFLNISVVPNPNFCISISCGTVNLSWSFNQVLSRSSPPYLSGSGLAENTYIIFAADMPLEENLKIALIGSRLRGTSLLPVAATTLGRTRTQQEAFPGDLTFLSRLSKCRPLPEAL